MRYNRYLYRLSLLAVPITDTVKMSISVADISADPIIGTPLLEVATLMHNIVHSSNHCIPDCSIRVY